MSTLTVRDLDDGLKARLRVRAAENGRSMEAEARAILRSTLVGDAAANDRLGSRIRERFAGLAGDVAKDLTRPSRKPSRIGEAPRALTA
jgi:plasmid stability protein